MIKGTENARIDRFLHIIKKARDESVKYLDHRVESPSELESYADHIAFNVEILKDNLGSIKNNNLFSFAVDWWALSGAADLWQKFYEPDIGGFLALYTATQQKPGTFPYIKKIHERRGFGPGHFNAMWRLRDRIHHVDDMLQFSTIKTEIDRLGLLPSPEMTIEKFDKMHEAIDVLEKKLMVKDKLALVEVPGSAVSSKEYNDPRKKPPFLGVIPTGETMIDLGNLKWVNLGTGLGIMPPNLYGNYDLFAPYEAHYIGHCGTDSGSLLLSLRAKVGEGWYPIALATLDYDDSVVKGKYKVTQLKTRSNRNFPELWLHRNMLANENRGPLGADEQDMLDTFNFLKKYNVSMDDFKEALEALALHDAITVLSRGYDFEIETPLIHEKMSNELRDILDAKKDISYKMEQVRDFVNEKNKGIIEAVLLKWFAGIVKELLPFYSGSVACYIRGPWTTMQNGVTVGFRLLIRSFKSNELVEAKKWYYDHAPKPHDDYPYSSGDQVRYERRLDTWLGRSNVIYKERINYTLPISISANFETDIDTIDSDWGNVIVRGIRNFGERWKPALEQQT